jgi:prophage tail gpP-like protein
MLFNLTCKSPLVTTYEGCIDPDFSFSTDNDTPVTSVVLDALSSYGFDRIQGDSAASVNVTTGKPIGKTGRRSRVNVDALKTQDAKAHDGERGYNFVSRLVTRLGVQLKMDVSSDNLGALLLQAPDYDQEIAYTLVHDPLNTSRIAGTRFFGDITIEDTNDDQYSECMVRGVSADKGGATSTSEPIARVTAAEMNPARPNYFSFAAAYKPLFIKDKNARDVVQATSVAKLALGLRGAKAFSISGEVDGIISHTGRVWTTGTMARVVIPDEQIDEPMFVFERVLMQDRDAGQRTKIRLIPKNAYQIGDMPEGG